MKPRLPTPEERRLWKESNRFTKAVKEIAEAEGDASLSPEAAWEATQAKTEKLAARKGLATKDPALKKLPPLAMLPAREAAKRFKTHAEVEATLDLHGMSKTEAYGAVSRFLKRCQGQGKRHVAIITGKGRPEEGVLKRELPHWLGESHTRPLISAFGHARPEKGGAGVMHILLKK